MDDNHEPGHIRTGKTPYIAFRVEALVGFQVYLSENEISNIFVSPLNYSYKLIFNVL